MKVKITLLLLLALASIQIKAQSISSELVEFLQDSILLNLKDFHQKNRFWFYDLLLLDILYRHNELGSSIFSSLFKKGNPALIFKFLDEETTLLEDFQVILKNAFLKLRKN